MLVEIKLIREWTAKKIRIIAFEVIDLLLCLINM